MKKGLIIKGKTDNKPIERELMGIAAETPTPILERRNLPKSVLPKKTMYCSANSSTTITIHGQVSIFCHSPYNIAYFRHVSVSICLPAANYGTFIELCIRCGRRVGEC